MGHPLIEKKTIMENTYIEITFTKGKKKKKVEVNNDTTAKTIIKLQKQNGWDVKSIQICIDYNHHQNKNL